ncbi:MFS transporter [SAR202 cluster bacterium AC-647-P02_OGT_505m]|nr:MFS transporter [SAR202 cluster bacterium AC-647-P02_OGT_505m]
MSNISRIENNSSRRLHTFDAFNSPNYRLLWGTNSAMYVSRWMQMTTLSWFVLEQTDSAFSVGLVGFFGMVPFLVLGIFGGYLADVLDRKLLIAVTQFLNLISAVIMCVLLTFGTVEYWYAYIAIIIPGIGWSLDMPSRRSLIMDIMGPQGLTNGVALDSVGMHTSKMIGPALAGALIAFTGVEGSYILLSIVMSVGCFLFLRVNQPNRPNQLQKSVGTTPGINNSDKKRLANEVFSNLSEGFKYAFSNQTIVAVIVITVFMNLLLFPYMQMVTVVSKNILHVGPLLMGILMASDGLGALVGSTLIASRNKMLYHGRFFLYGSILSLIALTVFSMSTWYLLSLPLLLILGIGTSGFGTMQSAIVLLVSRPEIRGRALGVVTLAIGAGPIGSLVVGAVSEWIGPADALLFNSILGLILVCLSGVFFPSIRGQIIPEAK